MRLIILVVLIALVLVTSLAAALIAPDDPLSARTVDEPNTSNGTEQIPAGSVPLSAGTLVRADIHAG